MYSKNDKLMRSPIINQTLDWRTRGKLPNKLKQGRNDRFVSVPLGFTLSLGEISPREALTQERKKLHGA
jgi:hypothetical protein